MGTTLFFLAPIGMLAVVWSLCFVGCFLNAQGVPSPYSDTIVVRSGLVAYWPLSDLLGTLNTKGATSKAGDLSGNGHDGTYTIPPPYPSGAQAVAKIEADYLAVAGPQSLDPAR